MHDPVAASTKKRPARDSQCTTLGRRPSGVRHPSVCVYIYGLQSHCTEASATIDFNFSFIFFGLLLPSSQYRGLAHPEGLPFALCSTATRSTCNHVQSTCHHACQAPPTLKQANEQYLSIYLSLQPTNPKTLRAGFHNAQVAAAVPRLPLAAFALCLRPAGLPLTS